MLYMRLDKQWITECEKTLFLFLVLLHSFDSCWQFKKKDELATGTTLILRKGDVIFALKIILQVPNYPYRVSVGRKRLHSDTNVMSTLKTTFLPYPLHPSSVFTWAENNSSALGSSNFISLFPLKISLLFFPISITLMSSL